MKYYVFGDIHGELEKLEEILGQIILDENSKLVFLGDYVDRGKRSAQVLNLLINIKEREKDNAIILKGNHDYMLSFWYHNRSKTESHYWEKNYLDKTKKSYYKVGWDKLPDHVIFINSLPTIFVTPTFSFVHSGAGDHLWGRPDGDTELVPGLYNVHGHTPLRQLPYFGKNRANLDTGACFPEGKLTCAVFEEGNRKPLKVIQA